jgi:soluble lytic murein transglycosylase
MALLVVTMISLGAGPLSAKTDKATEARSSADLIVQARDAFQKGKLPELERLMARTQGQLLAAWPDYWRTKLAIGIPGADARNMRNQVQGFLSRHPQHPLQDNLQRDLIAALAGKDLWREAAEASRDLPERISSPAISCVRARATSPGTEGPSSDNARATVAVGQESSDACVGLVALLAREDRVTAAYLRQRARWAAQTASASKHEEFMDIFRAHARGHDLAGRGPDPMKTEAILGRILRTAKGDSEAGLRAWRSQRRELIQEQDHYAAFAVGAALWRKTHPDAWSLMQEGWSSVGQQPDEILQIAAREAIRRGAWSRVLEIVAAMSETLQKENVWQYWKAMALKQGRRHEDGLALLKGVAEDFGFYGMLAREALGITMRIPDAAQVQLVAEDHKRLDRDAGMARSYALVKAGLRAEAVLEWSAAMRGRSDSELLKAALHARKAGFFDRMIAAADRTQQEHDFSLRYPTPFKDKVVPAARERAIDPWWVLGLIRQESRFIADARSPVGATGLMQIMPATGKMLAKQAGIKNTGNLQLNDVDLNVRLGTAYMRQLHDRFDGSTLLASAAYNAGPSRAVNWRAALPRRVEGAVFAESIPFAETRDYVKRVLANAALYHALHNGGVVPSLRQMLGEVGPGAS